MAQVFTGKVAIPGDKIEEYFKAMEEAEKAREPFRRYLMDLNREFADYLSKKHTRRTASKHSGIVEMFIEFVCRHTDVEKIEDITKGIANSYFRKWYKKKVWDSSTESDLKVAIKKFFQFLATEKGIENRKVLDSFK